MKKPNSLVIELRERKLKIVNFVLNLFLFFTLLVFVIYLVTFVTLPSKFEDVRYWFFWGLMVIFFILLLYIRKVLICLDIKKSFIILIFFLFSLATLVITLYGTSLQISYILIATVIISSSIVLSIKEAQIIFGIFCLTTLLVYLLHNFGVVKYTPELTESDFPNTLVSLFFIWIINHIVKIGYDQIEHSYQKAFEYSKKLEKLNRQLDRKVKLRTKQLEKSFEEQVKSIQCSAVIGDITKPLLHDLATPLTSMKGTVTLIEEEGIDESLKEYMEIVKLSVEQMERTINSARYFMKKKDIVSKFSPLKVISNILLILRSELTRNNIKIETDVSKLEMRGIVNLFERVVINILLNAIEELRQSDKERIISINGQKAKNYFILKIKDTGRGIREGFLDQLFSKDFTLKSEEGHLGLGLPFVKSVVEKNFKGRISIDSKVGEYTEFTIRFKMNKNVGKD